MERSLSKTASLAVILSLLFGLSGCFGPIWQKKTALTGEEPVTLKMWHLWASNTDPTTPVIEKVIREWNAGNSKVKIEVEAVENESYKNKIKNAVASNEAPDIFFVWGAGFVKPFVEQGKVLCLDEYMDDEFRNRLAPGALTNFTFDGKAYGIPTSFWVATLYANKEMFEKNNIKLPETYDDLLTAVKAFRRKGITPIAVGEQERWPGMLLYNVLALRTAGVKTCMDALNDGSFDRPEFIEAAAKLEELKKANAFDSNCMEVSNPEASDMFKNGQVPMFYMGSWDAGRFEADDSAVKGKVVPLKFPVISGGKGNENEFLGGAIDGFVVNANTQYKKIAAETIMSLTETFSKECYMAGIGAPTFKAEGIDSSRVNPLLAQIVESAKDASGFVLAWDTFLEGDAAEAHKNLVAEIFAGTKTPQQFAKEMQKLKKPE